MIVGYTGGGFDLFHVGHVNLLRNARSLCDRLIVGVSTDELLLSAKGKDAVVPYSDRVEVVRSCRHVDAAVPQRDLNKYSAWEKLRYDVLFVGDDWFDHDRWREYDRQLRRHGVKTIYLPYTNRISSTQIQKTLAGTKA